MNTDKLSLWEKAPIVGLFLAQGAYVWRWYVGEAAALPAAVVALAGVAAVAAIDGAMVATVAGMRQGRRSPASVAAILVTAGFGAAVALDLYGAISGASAWLHAGFALTIVCYLLHLSAPVVGTRAKDLAAKVAQAEAEAARLTRELARTSDEAAQARALVAQHAEDVARAQEEAGASVARERAEVAQAEEAVARERAEVARLRRELARRPQDDGAAWFEFNGQRFTLAQLAEATGTPSTTLRRKLAQVAGTTAQAAD